MAPGKSGGGAMEGGGISCSLGGVLPFQIITYSPPADLRMLDHACPEAVTMDAVFFENTMSATITAITVSPRTSMKLLTFTFSPS